VPVRALVDEALSALSADFDAIYSPIGRPSIPPEQLLRALWLQAFCTVRSERQLMEQLDVEYQLEAGPDCTMQAIARMKPTISRAIAVDAPLAVVTTTLGLPAAVKRR
jgi:transposase